jgi:uncharacterized coiled-coil protein SlyX
MFETSGPVPEWRVIYDHAATVPIDGVITYERLDTLLGRGFRSDRSPVYRAQKEMLEANRRTLVNVPRVGYRVARANEHAGLAGGQRRKARRAMTKAVRIVDGTDRSRLTSDETRRLDALEHNLKRQALMLRKTDARVAVVEKEVARSDDRMDLLVRTLKNKGVLSEGDLD